MTQKNEVLKEIALRWIFNKKDRIEFEARGVNFEGWPEFDAATALVRRFKHNCETRNETFALAKESASEALYERLMANPESITVLVTEEQFICKQNLLDDLLLEASIDPDNAEPLLADFLANRGNEIKRTSAGDLIKKTLKHLEERLESGNAITVLPGWELLSDAIGGFEGGRIGSLTAQTGFGKTAIAMQLLLDAAKQMACVFVNQEMLDVDLGVRLLANRLGKSSKDIYKLLLDANSYEEIAKLHLDIQNSKPVVITDGRSMSVDRVCSLIRSEVVLNDAKFVVIDYDQKLRLRQAPGEQEWMAMLKAVEVLEELAKELNIFILLLAQANDHGDPKSSARAIQPMSVQMYFHKDEDTNKCFLELKKNRFGQRGLLVEVDYQPATGTVTEVGVYEKPKPTTNYEKHKNNLRKGQR